MTELCRCGHQRSDHHNDEREACLHPADGYIRHPLCDCDGFRSRAPKESPYKCCRKGCRRYALEGAGSAKCDGCGKTYDCCPEHGGLEGAKRSLKSHVGLYHPGEARRG